MGKTPPPHRRCAEHDLSGAASACSAQRQERPRRGGATAKTPSTLPRTRAPRTAKSDLGATAPGNNGTSAADAAQKGFSGRAVERPYSERNEECRLLENRFARFVFRQGAAGRRRGGPRLRRHHVYDLHRRPAEHPPQAHGGAI